MRIMGKPKRKGVLYGHFAVEVVTVTKNVWSFYRTTSPAKARSAALAKNCALEVVRVVMITKTQYLNGLHNIQVLEKRRLSEHQHQRRVSSLRNERRVMLTNQKHKTCWAQEEQLTL